MLMFTGRANDNGQEPGGPVPHNKSCQDSSAVKNPVWTHNFSVKGLQALGFWAVSEKHTVELQEGWHRSVSMKQGRELPSQLASSGERYLR